MGVDGMEGGVMQDMVGSWKLEKRDPNFGDFLVCREVGWFLRQLMCNSTVDTEYRLSPDRSTLTKITSNWRGSSVLSRHSRANPRWGGCSRRAGETWCRRRAGPTAVRWGHHPAPRGGQQAGAG